MRVSAKIDDFETKPTQVESRLRALESSQEEHSALLAALEVAVAELRAQAQVNINAQRTPAGPEAIQLLAEQDMKVDMADKCEIVDAEKTLLDAVQKAAKLSVAPFDSTSKREVIVLSLPQVCSAPLPAASSRTCRINCPAPGACI